MCGGGDAGGAETGAVASETHAERHGDAGAGRAARTAAAQQQPGRTKRVAAAPGARASLAARRAASRGPRLRSARRARRRGASARARKRRLLLLLNCLNLLRFLFRVRERVACCLALSSLFEHLALQQLFVFTKGVFSLVFAS